VPDRVAAGCTSDIDEENYQEYSSFFWAGLSGHNRGGQSVAPPDFDGDGHVSLAESHAYALLNSNTIDISIKTSDTLLRAISKTKADNVPDLLTADAPYGQLIAKARPAELAVLDGLSAQFELSGNDRIPAARKTLDDIKKQQQEVDKQKGSRNRELKQISTQILGALKLRWPELANRWHPRVQELLLSSGDQLVAAAAEHPRYSDFQRLQTEVANLGEQHLDLERRWAKCQRLLYVAESVALAANLERVATPEQVARYQALVTAENGQLTPSASPQQTAQSAPVAIEATTAEPAPTQTAPADTAPVEPPQEAADDATDGRTCLP
jgi:hypothetical protein